MSDQDNVHNNLKLADDGFIDPTMTNSGQAAGDTIPARGAALLAGERADSVKNSLAYLFSVNADDFAAVPLSRLHLKVRPANCLASAECKTIADVLKKSVAELRAIRNMGTKSVDEILLRVKNFVIDPVNINQYVTASPGHDAHCFGENAKIHLDAGFRLIIEALLVGDEYAADGLPEKQARYLDRLKTALETVGAEICLEAYLNPGYSTRVGRMLWGHAASFQRYRDAMEIASQKINRLPRFTRERKAIPFIRAYSDRAGKKLAHLLTKCSAETTVSQIPLLFEQFRHDDEMPALAAEMKKFISWLDFDIQQIIATIFANIRAKHGAGSERLIGVLMQRLRGKTLEEIGACYGVTRERIRQLERKAFTTFGYVYKMQKYDLVMLVSALKDGETVLDLNEMQKALGDFAVVLWAYLKQNREQKMFYYSETLDAIVVYTDETMNHSESVCLAVIDELLAPWPDVIEVSGKTALIEQLAKANGVPIKMLEKVFAGQYQRSGRLYHKGRLTVVFMCEYVLKHYFPAGYKVADDAEANRFKRHLLDIFGSRATEITNRAIDAKVNDIGVLCDRGKHIHPDYMHVEQATIDAINDYLESSPRLFLPFKEIYEALKGIFAETQITNQYLLHGALKKYGCRFSTGRDFVRKVKSATYVDELESFVEKRGIVHKSEIFSAFAALREAGLGQVSARSANVFNIDNGCYIHASQFKILPEDYDFLRRYLTAACQDIPVNIRSVHDALIVQYPEFMHRNSGMDKNKLFAALNFMFREEFNFSRPYIAKLEASDITNRSVILQHIKDYDSITVDELMDICDRHSIRYVTNFYLGQSLAPHYVRIDRTTMMKSGLAGITEEVIAHAAEMIKMKLRSCEYIVGSKINDFSRFPSINVAWNEFLLENLIIQSKKVGYVFLMGNSLQRSNTIYIADQFKQDTFESFLVKILTAQVNKGLFPSKAAMGEWLQREGLVEAKLPNFLRSAAYFYVDETGVHCTGE